MSLFNDNSAILFKALPKIPEKPITITELLEKPSIRQAYQIDTAKNIDSIRKTIKRHLNKLSDKLGKDLIINFKGEGNGKADTYQLTSTAKLNGISDKANLMLLLAGSFLSKILPKSDYNEIETLLQQAESRLNDDLRIQHWRKRIDFAYNKVELYQVNADIENTIYQALLDDSRLAIDYIKKGQSEVRTHTGFPLKIVVSPMKRMLIIDNPNHNGTLTLDFHRIQAIRVVEATVTTPRVDINLDNLSQKIDQHIQPVYNWGEPVDLILKTRQEHKDYLQESSVLAGLPFEIRKQKNYLIYTYYQVYWTQELYDYLVANAKMVEVVEPAIIRENVIARLQSGLANYDE